MIDNNGHFTFDCGKFDLNADDGKVRFVASDYITLMHGTESYREDAKDEPEDLEIFSQPEDADAWIAARIKQLESEDDLYHITQTQSGLDSVEYHVLTVDREVYDAEYDEWEINNKNFGDHTHTTLPDSVRDAAYASMRSYHAYLDYEADDYHGIDA